MHNRIPTRRARVGVQRCAAIILLFGWLASPALSQSDTNNAAYWYQRALNRLQTLTPDQQEMLYSFDANDQGRGASPEVQSLINDLSPVIEMARRGAAQEFSDFGLDRSKGFGMLMPHLGEMRNLSRLLNADARLRLERGDSSGAAQSLATMLRMSDHLCDDRTAISSLVGQAISGYADTVLQRGIDEGKFNAGDAMTLLKASSRFSPTDPFRYTEVMAGEQELMITSIEDAIANSDGGDGVGDIAAIAGSELPLEFMTMDKEALRIDVSRLDLFMDRAVEAFMIEDRERGQFELEQLEKEIERGDHGLFAQLFVPALGKLYERMVESEDQLETRMKSLQAIASGEVTPGEAANAALWYLRAIEELNKIPAEQRNQYRAIAKAPGNTIVSEITQNLLEARLPIGLFTDGSMMKRCDFEFARLNDERVQREYVLGMRDGVRLMQADAVRLAQIGDHDSAAKRLAVCFRMSKHLGDDKAMLSSLTSHDIFSSTTALYEAIGSPHANAERTTLILDAVGRTSRKDPFGYIGGIVHDRELALNWLYRLGAHEPAEEAAAGLPSPKRLVNGWDADQLLSTLLLLDQLRHPVKDDEPDAAMNFALISDVVSLDAVSEIRSIAQAFVARQSPVPTEESERQKFDMLFALKLPHVAPVRDHITAARQTVRDVLRSLRTHEASEDEMKVEHAKDDAPVSE